MKKQASKRRPHGRAALVTAVCAAGLALAAPGTALAVSTVSLGALPNGPGVTVQADAGIENQITLTALPGQITIFDAADTLTSGGSPACTGDGTNTVVCSDPTLTTWQVSLGDMDDRFQAAGPLPGAVNGEEGDDELIGGAGGERFEPGAGKDTVSGNDGDDVFLAAGSEEGDTVALGAGADVLVGEGPSFVADLGAGDDTYLSSTASATAAATVDGGPGIDALSVLPNLAGPFFPSAIDLAAGSLIGMTAGTVPHAVPGFEDVTGTAIGGDTIAGTDGPNVITTGIAALLRTIAGVSPPNLADTVDPRGGADIVATGDSDDTINVLDGFSDRVACGSGTDTVSADQFDVLEACERVSVKRIEPALPDTKAPACQLTRAPRKMTRKAFFRGYTAEIRCDEKVALFGRILVSAKARKGKVLLSKVGDVTLAESTGQAAAGTVASITLKPARRLARGLRRTFVARVLIDARDEFGNSTSLTERVRVTAPKPKQRTQRKGAGGKRR